MSSFTNKNLHISKFIMTNKKLEVINLWDCDLEIIIGVYGGFILPRIF